jgi:WD40 repeat protein
MRVLLFPFVLFTSIVSCQATSAFVLSHHSSRIRRPTSFQLAEPLMFDDFEGNILGDAVSSTTPPQLQERISDYKNVLVKKDTQIAKNWRQGNWKVRGFSLDKYSTTATNNDDTIHVSSVALGLDEQSICVGRTDGSVVFVTLGTDYWTKFRATTIEDDGQNSTISQMVPEIEETSLVPFEVTHQFMAGNSITTMLVAADENDDEAILVTAGADGIVHVWTYPDATHEKVLPLQTLEAHKGPVVAVKKVSMEGNKDLLFSASQDGTIALWDLWTGDLVLKCDIQDDGPSTISCADVESSHIYVGLSSGYVLGYLVEEMVLAASEGGICPMPNGRFKAHEGGVTAILCAGEGTLGLSRLGTKSSILLTGGVDGVIKQWEMISDESSSNPTKLQHWPRLSSQRMKRRAHLFQGHAPGPITSLACVDQSKILSAGADGTVRVWSPSKGTEMFRMDGFTESLKSLCLVEDLLITDGMEQFVCVHDFDVDDSEFDEGYELES